MVRVKRSGIHHRGLFASCHIEKGTRVIEYIGDKVTKTEAERRADKQLNKAEETGDGAVYIFTLNDRYDIDGNASQNTARLANHSCAPNCEADIAKGRIWLIAIRDIKKKEEITYNYNFDIEHFEDHPCRCGAKNCVGYIVGEQYWPKLKKAVKKKMRKMK